MYNSWLYQVRSDFETIEVLEKAIVAEMLFMNDNPKERAICEHRITNFATLIQEKSKNVLAFIREETALKKEDLAVIEGQRSLKSSDKKKPTDVIWQNFYDRAKYLRDQQRKQYMNTPVIPKNTVYYYRQSIFKPPFKYPYFSQYYCRGKYVDMHHVYLYFINICKLMYYSKYTTILHDYLWFLHKMDKFDDFPINRKIKHMHKYMKYLEGLELYLKGFLFRYRPLGDQKALYAKLYAGFIEKYEANKLPGWDQTMAHYDEDKTEYCLHCDKIFITNYAFVNHLMGKKHLKLSQNEPIGDPQYAEAKARATFAVYTINRKKSIALCEYRIMKLREYLANVVYDTMNLVRKKQTRGYEYVEENDEDSSESEEADAPIYNPKNLPLGWDGKPIPYWLYKLHGLGIYYKCEICGNYSYWGRRAFYMHFQEWRHTYGMKCLKIPNTIHFKDITTINDALALHEKLIRESQESQFRPDIEEEYEDNEGNLLNKKTYLDMKKQGLFN